MLLTFRILLIITSVILILLVLLHKGQGGGLSDMFGGGITSNAVSSGMAEKNLNRITIIVAIIWVLMITFLGILVRT